MSREIWTFLMGIMICSTLSSQVQEGDLLSHWTADDLPASEIHNNTYNEVWGLAINGAEYAIIGSTMGTHFINVTDAENPVQDFFVQGSSYGPHIIHRDYHDHNGYLYIVADEEIGTLKSRMQIVDISNLPESVDLVYDNDDRIRKAHNIFIDTAQSRLYAFAANGGDDPYAPMRAYDISDPLDPVQLGEFRFELDGVSVNHYHDGFIKNHIAYLNAGFDGLVIADLTDPENPELLSHLLGSDYPDSGYNHSGWLSDDGKFYFLGDETWGTDIKVFDVSDPMNVQYITKFNAGNPDPFSITHNQIVHCNYLYTSYYYDGLQVFDISDPSEPQRVLQYSTSELSPREAYEGAWGVYPFLPSGNILVSDMQEGLFVIRNFDSNCGNASSVEEDGKPLPLVKISPNPSTGNVLIQSNEGIKSVEVYSSNGSRILSLASPRNIDLKINLRHPGIYYAEIWTDTGRITEKIIIQR